MKNVLSIFVLALIFMSCNSNSEKSTKIIDWQGHRGARGVYPENTWPAFQYALDKAVQTLEMDVVISADSQVVVSHEPFMNHLICYDSTGEKIEEEREKQFNIYELTYDQIKEFDCGSSIHPGFLKQKHMQLHKPLLKEVLEKVKLYVETHQLELPKLNVEIKYVSENAGKYHPDIATYSELVYEVLKNNYPADLWNIQSFDFDVLKYWHKKYPKVKLAALVEDNADYPSQIEYLGFTPTIYSPYYILLDKSTVTGLHEAGMLVVPWTVNDEKEAKRLIEIGVDGIITDYPDLASNFKDIQ